MAVWRYGPVWTGPYLSQGLLMPKDVLGSSPPQTRPSKIGSNNAGTTVGFKARH